LTDDKLLKEIEVLGRDALEKERSLELKMKDTYLEDWKQAFFYFTTRMSYRGRFDWLSEEYAQYAHQKVESYLQDKTPSQLVAERPHLNSKDNPIGFTKTRDGHAYPYADREMVYGALKKMPEIPNSNFVEYARKSLAGGDLDECYRQIDAIPSVGDKLVCMYLRDVTLLYDLENKVAASHLGLLLPVDTWVRKFCRRLGISSSDDEDELVKNKMIEACASLNPPLSPILFDHGLWTLSQIQYAIKNYDLIARNLSLIQALGASGFL
jgi:hypothetical protein